MDTLVLGLHMDGVEVDRGIKEGLEDQGDHFLHMVVILVVLEWVLMGALDSKEDQGFLAVVGAGEPCRELMSPGYLERKKVHLGRKLWRKEGMAMEKGQLTVKWEEIKWWETVGTRTSHHLVDTVSLGGEGQGQVCQPAPTQGLTPSLLN